MKVWGFPIYPLLHTCISTPIINIIHQNSTFFFFFTDELILAYHNPPKSIVYLRVHFWCYKFSGFGQMYNDIHPSYITQNIFTALKHSMLCLFNSQQPHTTSNLATADLFIVSTVSPFQIGSFHLVNTHLRVFCVFSWLDSSFLLIAV
uniref:Uncharacterized protein n=1 Tax=Rousettus aegyptiacus TaxID=9407 RepID=A0A7J8JIK1_ROUAE|nr:hypothetical protein HJG63_010222 [Rousettus aegyptiacus]